MKKTTFLLVALLTFNMGYSQLTLEGQYRVRPEFSNGYGRPLMKEDKSNFYVSQRARLGLHYKHSIFDFTFVAQDVRVWGNTSHLALDNNGLLSIFEASAAIHINQHWRIKMGRQPISYDNQRIFGGLDWAMQARRHDAAIVTYKDSTWQVDVGASYNQQDASNKQSFYELNNYKTFQYVWAHKEWKNFNASVLFLNNGNEQIYYQDSVKKKRINFSQTMGTHLNYSLKKLDITAFGYYQMGFTKDNRTLLAYDASIQASYKPIKALGITLGGEILSGTSAEFNSSNDRNHSFSPLYGTNHGFNGYMDYFYVGGEHENSTGLINPYLKLNYKYKKFGFELANHVFFTAADVVVSPWNGQTDEIVLYDRYMGYEVDFTFSYQPVDEVMIQAGYSHMIGSETLHFVKGNDNTKTSGWGYVMLTIQPFKNLKF